MRVTNRLSRVLTAIHTDIKTAYFGIITFNDLSPLTKKLVNGITLGLVETEVIGDVPFGNNEGVL